MKHIIAAFLLLISVSIQASPITLNFETDGITFSNTDGPFSVGRSLIDTITVEFDPSSIISVNTDISGITYTSVNYNILVRITGFTSSGGPVLPLNADEMVNNYNRIVIESGSAFTDYIGFDFWFNNSSGDASRFALAISSDSLFTGLTIDETLLNNFHLFDFSDINSTFRDFAYLHSIQNTDFIAYSISAASQSVPEPSLLLLLPLGLFLRYNFSRRTT